MHMPYTRKTHWNCTVVTIVSHSIASDYVGGCSYSRKTYYTIISGCTYTEDTL